MIDENWIYVQDKLPPKNERVLLYIITNTNIEYSKFGVWNGKFYETSYSDYSKEEIIAWQTIEPPKKTKEIKKNVEFEKYAENWANSRVNYELEYANAMEEPMNKEEFINWVKDHIYYNSKRAFNDAYIYLTREKGIK